jgi:hypothetical protein
MSPVNDMTAHEASIFLPTTPICSGIKPKTLVASNIHVKRMAVLEMGFRRCDNEDYGPLGCSGLWFVKMQMFRRNILPPASGQSNLWSASAGFLLDLASDHEDGGDMFLRSTVLSRNCIITTLKTVLFRMNMVGNICFGRER